MKTKKIDREFLISDDTVNCYGFRLLTEGYLIDEYKKNPIGYYMHNREDGVVVRWEDLRVDGKSVYGKPVINLSNEKGQQIVEEIENKFLNGASVGHIVALEWSEDPSMMVPGQTGPTITKWYNRECSLCDVPGNFNALALFDKDGNEIKLADFKTKNSIITMDKIILTAAQLAKIPNLKANPTQDEANTAFDALVAEAGKVPGLTKDLSDANAAKKKAEDDLAAEKNKNVKASVDAQLDAALAAKKITVEQKTLFAKQYEGKPEDLKALLDTMKPFASILSENVLTDHDKAELAKLAAMSGDELFSNGKMDRLKDLDANVFKAKYKEAFGEDYKEPAEK